jgi:cysteine/O-acetylserine efflux protein
MLTSLLPVISYALISIFTPGPSNIASASMGLLYGYRNTIRYLVGLATGFLLVMLFSAVISFVFLDLFPAVEPVLRLVGAAYILYLAFLILKASYAFDPMTTKPMGFTQGILLQLFNPKGIIFGLTVFSGFIAPMTDNIVMLVLAALLLTLAAFTATSLWALFGWVIKDYLRRPRVNLAINIIFALFLVYTAIDLAAGAF